MKKKKKIKVIDMTYYYQSKTTYQHPTVWRGSSYKGVVNYIVEIT